jgi:hypothetical protein
MKFLIRANHMGWGLVKINEKSRRPVLKQVKAGILPSYFEIDPIYLTCIFLLLQHQSENQPFLSVH